MTKTELLIEEILKETFTKLKWTQTMCVFSDTDHAVRISEDDFNSLLRQSLCDVAQVSREETIDEIIKAFNESFVTTDVYLVKRFTDKLQALLVAPQALLCYICGVEEGKPHKSICSRGKAQTEVICSNCRHFVSLHKANGSCSACDLSRGECQPEPVERFSEEKRQTEELPNPHAHFTYEDRLKCKYCPRVTMKEHSLQKNARNISWKKNNMKTYDFELTIDLIMKSLRGLEIELVVDQTRLKIHPPIKGVLFTHEEIKDISRLDGWKSEKLIQEIMERKFGKG